MFDRMINRRTITAIVLMLILSVTWWQCDQSPTSLEDDNQDGDLAGAPIVVSLLALDYDYTANSFFATVEVLSRDSIAFVQVAFAHNDSTYHTALLTDDGLGVDIIAGDHNFNTQWTPDSINPTVDRDWEFRVLAKTVPGDSAMATDSITLALPVPPTIDKILAPDTLRLLTAAYVLDTLQVKVSHRDGLDAVDKVTFRSFRPTDVDSVYGGPYELFDDGGAAVLFIIPLQNDTLRLTSFDRLAGDGIYSFPIALRPSGATGINRWLIRAWATNGLRSAEVADSLVILPAAGGSAPWPSPEISNPAPWN